MKTREHRGTMAVDRTEEQIRHEAYLIWKREGCPPGHELEHWLAAKELIRHRLNEVAEHRKLRDEESLVAAID